MEDFNNIEKLMKIFFKEIRIDKYIFFDSYSSWIFFLANMERKLLEFLLVMELANCMINWLFSMGGVIMTIVIVFTSFGLSIAISSLTKGVSLYLN